MAEKKNCSIDAENIGPNRTKYGCLGDQAIPLQAWTGPEGSNRLRFPDFKTIGTLRW
jgi:hypothetical protein